MYENQHLNLIQVIKIAIIGVSAISAYMGLPFLAGLLSDKLLLSPEQTGWLVSVDLLGIGIVSITAPLWINKFIMRKVVFIALLIIVIANGLTALAARYELLILFRLVAGMAGGFVFTQAMVTLASDLNTERNIGIFSASATTLMCLTMIVMPYTAETMSVELAILIPAIIPLFSMSLLLSWPNKFNISTSLDDSSSDEPLFQVLSPLVIMALAGVLLFTANIGIGWGFVERIGSEYNFDPISLGQGIAFANFVSVGGGLIAAWLANRVGHFIPLALGLLIQGSCMIWITKLGYNPSITIFILLLSIYFLLWNFIDVYQISVLMDVEPSGKTIGLVPAVTATGTAAGPSIATVVLWGDGYLNTAIVA